MNWFQGENDIKAKFGESEAGGRRSNELRQLDALRASRKNQRSSAIAQLRVRVTGALSQLLRRKPAPNVARGGGTQPRAARAFRQK